MIGMTAESDEQLVQRAHSFASPPSITVRGGRVDIDGYVPERRALRINVEDRALRVSIKPERPFVNPVFELVNAPAKDIEVSLDGAALEKDEYRWDGHCLWLNITLQKQTNLSVIFSAHGVSTTDRPLPMGEGAVRVPAPVDASSRGFRQSTETRIHQNETQTPISTKRGNR
jgi:hypothetical protein